MSFFTAQDGRNLKRLVDHQKVVQRRNALLTRAPHIGTHTTLRVMACTDEYDYQDPVLLPPKNKEQLEARRDLHDIAIVTDWTFTQTGCDHVVSCNPFYPKSKRCSGMATYAPGDDSPAASTSEPQDAPFSFRLLNGQVYDACQPVCYDPAVRRDNMVGVMSRFTFNKCRVYDPLILAFYIDPTRRFVNPETQILERKAFTVRDVLLEPQGDAALLASIPPDYCYQYAETLKSDGSIQGMDMYKCGENALVWSTSWLIGDSLPKLGLISFEKTLNGNDCLERDTHYPPTRGHLASRDSWLENRVQSKRPLRFPLRLSDLGIVRNTKTEWLVWTDEYSHLEDGRNDVYGGRLVQRARPVDTAVVLRDRTAAATSAVEIRSDTADGRLVSGHSHHRPTVGGKEFAPIFYDDADNRFQSQVVKSIQGGVAEYQRVLAEAVEQSGLDFFNLGGGLAYGAAYEYMSRELNLPPVSKVLKGAFRALADSPAYAKKIALKTIGFWVAESASSHAVEAAITRVLMKRLKGLATIQALGPLALVVELISLLGMAIDITFVLLNAFGVSTPTSRRENFVSDRRLYRLAQTEVELNHRLYGVGNIELTPFRFVINSSYVNPEEDIRAYMSIMPIVYAARQLNSDGGLLKPGKDGDDGDDEFEVDSNGTVHYTRKGVRRFTLRDQDRITDSVDGVLRSIEVPPIRQRDPDKHKLKNTNRVETLHYSNHYYFPTLMIISILVGYFYPTNHWVFAVALLFTVLVAVRGATYS